MSEAGVRIGVLGVQGAFVEHVAMLHRLPGVQAFIIRGPADLSGQVRCMDSPSSHQPSARASTSPALSAACDEGQIDGLVLPGGESTSMGLGLCDSGLITPIRALAATTPTFVRTHRPSTRTPTRPGHVRRHDFTG